MSLSRINETAFEYLVAELAVCPFTAKSARTNCLIYLDADMNGATDELWQEAELTLKNQFPSYSIDEINSLRDWLLFNPKLISNNYHGVSNARRIPLGRYLSNLAHNTLEFSRGFLRPKAPEWIKLSHSASVAMNYNDAVHFWRWLSFSLPPELLIASFPSNQLISSQIELVGSTLSRVLQEYGYVEPHMHLGAAIDFSNLWVGLQHNLARLGSESGYKSMGADFEYGARLPHMLIRTFISRYILASFLHTHHNDESVVPTFSIFYTKLISGEGGQTDNYSLFRYAPQIATNIRKCFSELTVEPEEYSTSSYRDMQHLYKFITKISAKWHFFPSDLSKVQQADTIYQFFPHTQNKRLSPEISFISRSLSYMEQKELSGYPDYEFSALFWQIIRNKVSYYRYVVQRPLTPGLQWFIRHYYRIKTGSSPFPTSTLVQSSAKTTGIGRGLRSLEIRLSLAPSADECYKFCRELEYSARVSFLQPKEGSKNKNLMANKNTLSLFEFTKLQGVIRNGSSHKIAPNITEHPEFGVVFHINKERVTVPRHLGSSGYVQATVNAMDSNSDPLYSYNNGCRFAYFYRINRKSVIALGRTVLRYPLALQFIRGIDVTSDELAIPTWVIAPFYRYLRKASNYASSHLAQNLDINIPPLNATAHVGEDYVHLLTGLRRIDEAIDHFNMQQGDRLGHALALGANPASWAKNAGAISMTKIERIFDLVWEWKFTKEQNISVTGTRVQYLSDEIVRLSNEVFTPEFTRSSSEKIGGRGDYLEKDQGLIMRSRIDSPTTMASFVDLLYSDHYLRQINFPRNHQDSNLNTEGNRGFYDQEVADSLLPIFHQYLRSPQCFVKGQEKIIVNPRVNETEILVELQQALRRKVGKSGIFIEVNPSSNLLIGNLSDFNNHPLWRLKPPGNTEDEMIPLSICIGSDDPIIFTTDTRSEYQHLYNSFLRAGLTDSDARLWLDNVRKTGLESRFTLPYSDDIDIWTPMNVSADDLLPPP